MSGREGGRKKPLQHAEKEKKAMNNKDHLAHQQKLKDEKKALEQAKNKGPKKDPMAGGSGIKKSGKK